MELLKDRVAMITGGTGALGRAVADHFLAMGAKVVVPWIVEVEVPMFHQRMGGRYPEANIMLGKVDLGNEAEVAKFVGDAEKRFGRVDALVNLVGGFWGFKTVADLWEPWCAAVEGEEIAAILGDYPFPRPAAEPKTLPLAASVPADEPQRIEKPKRLPNITPEPA